MRARFFSKMSPNKKLILLVLMVLSITVLQNQIDTDLEWEDCAELETADYSYSPEEFSEVITYKPKEPCQENSHKR